MRYLNRYEKKFSMNIIALFCDIDHFLFLRDKQIVAYSKGGDLAGWNLHIRRPKTGRCG